MDLLRAPVSPTAAALGKFVEAPVGHFSGIPNINVPLYGTEIKGVPLNISLSYHASGLKVKEIPGPVGAGWALNAGGVITRIVRGYPDTHDPHGDTGGYDTADSLAKIRVLSAYQIGWDTEFDEFEQYDLLRSAQNVYVSPEVQTLYTRTDTEIDQYYYNFMGYSGQFTFTNEGKPMLLGASDLKIEYANKVFKIVDGKGIEYYFEAKERSLDLTGEADSISSAYYVSSWFLNKIYIPQHKQTINFSYKSFLHNKLYPLGVYHEIPHALSSVVYHVKFSEYLEQSPPYTPANFNLGICPPYTFDYSSIEPQGYSTHLFLDEITWDNNKIKIFGDTGRHDLYKYKYDSIEVTASGMLVKKIKLCYGYFNESAPHKYLKRLKLDSLFIGNQKYGFEYFESLHGKPVPGITASGQDLWGFYNGEDDETGIPYQKFFSTLILGNPNHPLLLEIGPNSMKNPDYKFAQLGTLRSITYPTGGRVTYEYEGNDYTYYPSGGSGIDAVANDVYTQFVFDSTIKKTCFFYSDPAQMIGGGQEERKFVIHKDQMVTLRLKMGLIRFDYLTDYENEFYNYYGTYPNGSYASAALRKFDPDVGFYDLKSFEISPADSIGLPPDQTAFELIRDKGYIDTVLQVFLTEGSYELHAEVAGTYTVVDIELSGVFPYLKKPGVYTAGGLRIKSVRAESGTSNGDAIITSYKYENDTLSSGVLESPFSNLSTSSRISHIHFETEEDNGQGDTGVLDDGILDPDEDIDTNLLWYYQESALYYDITTNPLIPLGNGKGGVIGYGRVEEIREDQSKTVYHFTTSALDESFADQYPESLYSTRSRISIDNSWKRGLPILTEVYDASGGILTRSYSDYFFDTSSIYNKSISMSLDEVYFYPNAPYTDFAGYEARVLFLYQGNQNALKVRDSTVNYSPTGNIIDVVKYEYHPNSYPHTYPVKITKVDSKGEREITNFKYPQDYSIGSTPSDQTALSVKNLIDKNVVSIPLETYVQKMGATGDNLRTTGGQFVSFKQNDPLPDTLFSLHVHGGITDFAPATISAISSSKDTRYRPVINFHQYSSFGNIVEQSKYKNIREAILWGYHHQHPVVRVIGSTYGELLNLVDTNLLNSPPSEFALLNELDKIRTYYKNTNGVQVYTYAYSPLIGLTTEVDPNGRKTSYTYDSQGRLSVIWDHEGNVVKKICYNYHGQPEDCTLFGNVLISQNFTRNNCTNDSTGTTVTFTVPANTFFASTQAAANAMAQAKVDAEGQAYANANGTCQLLFSSQEIGDYYYKEGCDPLNAIPIWVSILEGTYKGTTQTEADELAEAAAQEYANTYGACEGDEFDLKGKNGKSFGMNVYLYNVNTEEEFFLYIPASQTSAINIGTIPAGEYDITLTPHPNTGQSYSFIIGCGFIDFASGAVYRNVMLFPGCDLIDIRP